MNYRPLICKNVFVMEPEILKDERGYFFESFSHKSFCDFAGQEFNFVQDNHSLSKKNVNRGIHMQLEPYAQGKLIRVIHGKIRDIIIDLRKNSPSYLQVESIELSDKNFLQLWVPRGFAHGFIVESNYAEVIYKVDNYYNKEFERILKFDDNVLMGAFNSKKELLVSKKDLLGLSFSELEKEINFFSN